MASDEIISSWLMPAAAEREFFSGVIAELAARFDAPVFEPHVTIAGGNGNESQVIAALEQIQHSPALELEIENVAFSALFTKTLFVQFRASSEAAALSDSIAEAAGLGSDYEFNPHLSLLYSDITEAEKESLTQAITIPFQRVRFDRVKVISTRVPITSRKEIEAWVSLGECELRDSAT